MVFYEWYGRGIEHTPFDGLQEIRSGQLCSRRVAPVEAVPLLEQLLHKKISATQGNNLLVQRNKSSLRQATFADCVFAFRFYGRLYDMPASQSVRA